MTGCIVVAVILAVCGVFAFVGQMTLRTPKTIVELRASDKEKAEPYFRGRSRAAGGLFFLLAGFVGLMGYRQIDHNPWIGWALLGLFLLIFAYTIVFCVVWRRVQKRIGRKGRKGHGQRV